MQFCCEAPAMFCEQQNDNDPIFFIFAWTTPLKKKTCSKATVLPVGVLPALAFLTAKTKEKQTFVFTRATYVNININPAVKNTIGDSRDAPGVSQEMMERAAAKRKTICLCQIITSAAACFLEPVVDSCQAVGTIETPHTLQGWLACSLGEGYQIRSGTWSACLDPAFVYWGKQQPREMGKVIQKVTNSILKGTYLRVLTLAHLILIQLCRGHPFIKEAYGITDEKIISLLAFGSQMKLDNFPWSSNWWDR